MLGNPSTPNEGTLLQGLHGAPSCVPDGPLAVRLCRRTSVLKVLTRSIVPPEKDEPEQLGFLLLPPFCSGSPVLP